MLHRLILSFCVFFCAGIESHELVDIREIDSCICVNIDNPLYPSCTKAYLVRQVAKQLSRVQKELERDCITLVVLEAYRPFSYASFFETPFAFVPIDECHPIVNGHYRGTAVDVTLAYQDGQTLEMPPFLNVYELQHLGMTYNDFSCRAYHNLQKLQKAMAKHRFISSPTEWWHFDYREWSVYPVLDVPFD